MGIKGITESTLEVGGRTWFYREAVPEQDNGRPPVVLLHGLVSQSYGWRKTMPELAAAGFRAIAPDWLGCGFSQKVDRLDFSYRPEALAAALGEWIDAMELDRFSLVTQGFLGTAGLLYALGARDRVERLAILNGPVTPDAKLPWKMAQLGIPLVGDMLTQDPLLVDRILEGGSPYQVADEDLDVYRRPFLKSSDAGRSLLAIVQRLAVPKVMKTVAAGFPSWAGPVLVLWGDRDPWTPVAQAEAFVKTLPQGELVILEEVGHYPQEDWPEKVNEALLLFLRRKGDGDL